MVQSAARSILNRKIPGSTPGGPATTTKRGEEIRRLLNEKLSYSEIVAITGVSKGAISYHAGKVGLSCGTLKRFNWDEIQKHYDAGNSKAACLEKFGCSKGGWDQAIKNGRLQSHHKEKLRATAVALFMERSPASPGYLKRYAIRLGIVKEICFSCGLTNNWNGKPLVLWLDHINGKGDDWTTSNLRMVCPNCDSQSPTFAGRNMKRS